MTEIQHFVNDYIIIMLKTKNNAHDALILQCPQGAAFVTLFTIGQQLFPADFIIMRLE